MEYVHMIVQRTFGIFPCDLDGHASLMSSVQLQYIVLVYIHVGYSDVAIRHTIENDLCINNSVL